MQHDVYVRTSVADVDHAVRGDSQVATQRFDDGHLAVAGRDAPYGAHLAGVRIEVELRAEDVLRRHDPRQRRLHDKARRGRHDEEGEARVLVATGQKVHQLRNAALEPHAPSRFNQVFTPHAAELRIVPYEIRQLAPLLHKIALGQTGDALLETRHSQELAQHEPRVIETQCLVEIGGNEEVTRFPSL